MQDANLRSVTNANLYQKPPSYAVTRPLKYNPFTQCITVLDSVKTGLYQWISDFIYDEYGSIHEKLDKMEGVSV